MWGGGSTVKNRGKERGRKGRGSGIETEKRVGRKKKGGRKKKYFSFSIGGEESWLEKVQKKGGRERNRVDQA